MNLDIFFQKQTPFLQKGRNTEVHPDHTENSNVKLMVGTTGSFSAVYRGRDLSNANANIANTNNTPLCYIFCCQTV